MWKHQQYNRASQPAFRDRALARFATLSPFWLSGAAAGIIAVASPAMAQAVPDPTDGEILVTAQKRSQNIQDVAVSITALGSENLASIGRQNIAALATQVPGLQVNQYSPTVTIFNIRGVSQVDFADSQESPIAFYSDEVYIGSLGAISGMMFDLDRVEVLRGPQGTLFGRNATGGLIHVISAKPSDTFSAFATTTIGSFDQFSTEGAITGPLGEGLRGRLSFTTDYHDGYIDNRIGPDPGQTRFWAGRGQIAADIGDNGELTVKLQGMRNRKEHSAGAYSFAAAAPDADGLGRFIGPNEDYFGTCAGCNALGYSEPDSDPFTGSFNDPNVFDRKYWSGTARYVHDFGDITLTSITDLQKLKKDYTEDNDMSPIASVRYITHQNLHQISQEIRLSGHSSRLDWTAGVYAIEIDTDNTYDAPIDFIDTTLSYDGNMRTRSLAAFAQLEYKLTDEVTVTGGLRYSKDWKRTDFVNRINGEDIFVFNSQTVGSLARRRDGDYSGKIEFAYSPTTDVLTYLSVNRGTKSGGFASPSSPPSDPSTVPFKPETLTSYEGGAKLTIFGGTTHLNVSAFYYDYHGYQSFTVVPPTTFTISNQNAVIKGMEAEFNARPFSGFYMQIFASLLDTKVKGLVLPSGRIANGKMPQAPKLSLGGLARYQFALGSIGKLSLQTDWKYDGIQYFSAFNPQVDRERTRIVGNARISFQPPSERWEAAVFVNNLTDREYRIGNADASGFIGDAQQTFAPPRWIGGSVTVRFK
jgi:iron complex outermembrane receptor protein